jgi:hypothetical protein
VSFFNTAIVIGWREGTRLDESKTGGELADDDRMRGSSTG